MNRCVIDGNMTNNCKQRYVNLLYYKHRNQQSYHHLRLNGVTIHTAYQYIIQRT